MRYATQTLLVDSIAGGEEGSSAEIAARVDSCDYCLGYLYSNRHSFHRNLA